jgi:hypothetical protein
MCVSIPIFVLAVGLASAPIHDFRHRVSDYARLHKKLEAQLPRLKLTDSPEAITGHRKELAAKIQEARGAVKPNEIFTPEISAEFRRLIAHAMRGHRAKQVRQSLQHAEPVQVPLRVNAPYPENLPLQSTPPTLLLHLPKLPPEVDYRVAGHSLVLRDAGANLIVDFIPDAIP